MENQCSRVSIGNWIGKVKHLFATGLVLLSVSAHANNTQHDIDQAVSHILQQIELPNIPAREYQLSDYADAESLQKDILPALKLAIADASKQGGGKITVPAGKWFVGGPIHLQSRIELHLSEGSHLLFSGEPAHYLPVVEQRWEGTEVFAYSPLIYANHVEDIAITGTGIIDGNADSQFHAWYQQQDADIRALRKQGFDGEPLAKRVYGKGHYLRPDLLQILNAKRVLLEGYTALNSPFWVNHIVYTEHATLRDLKVDSHFPNNDGVDVDSCSLVLVENNHFSTGDDSIVIKSGRDLDGRNIAKPSHSIVVRNNTMGGEDGLGLGSEMSGGIYDVYFLNNTLVGGSAAFRFKANPDRGGKVENIYIQQATVGQYDHLFWFQLDYPSQWGGNFKTQYNNIFFNDINAAQVDTVFFMRAPDDWPLGKVQFQQVNVENAEHIFDVKNVSDLDLRKVNIGKYQITGQLQWLAE
ncbi:glycoside hydrolase family 28 protein [Planctobacterium marinum]|uniref:glycoside hydrolase family 28 protein n=1 Tax=Planctobacterium marinum TaxID=1631968 RepID=UPI001E2ECF57|nr:glycoside hydrolase family 28 protein [Planctobacterium marinum]MCC2604697.1 glycoside hydrolase family 28 protein [Planctobacterium marinum]